MRVLLAAVSVVTVLAAGCDGERKPVTAPASAPVTSGTTAAADRPSRAADRDAQRSPAELPAGQASVWSDEAGIGLLANRAPRYVLLDALQAEAGFELEIAEGVVLGPPVTASLSGASLDEALALALGGAPCWLQYGADPESGERLLLAVRVDDAGPADAGTRRRETSRPRVRAERVSEAERRERHERSQSERSRELASPDPQVRSAAAAWIHADYRSIPLLTEALLSDPDPATRAAAAETLGEAMDEHDERAAAASLIRALDDPDPEVMIAALEALEAVGEPVDVPAVSPLLQHPDPRVREQAIETIEWIRD